MFGLVSESKVNRIKDELRQKKYELEKLKAKWNKLVAQINYNGGQRWLDQAVIPDSKAKAVSQFTDTELRSLLQLVHPDKHDGKASAVALTQKINKLRG